MTTLFQRARMTMVATAVTISVCSAWAGDTSPVLIQGQGTSVTVQDILGDATRIPPELRTEVLARPNTVTQMASNLYVYRRLAQMAQADGLDQQPTVAAAMRAAHEKILADAWLAALDDKTRPSVKAAEVKAQAIYKAEPQRFATGEEVRVRHILVAGTTAEAKAQAQSLRQALLDGADFAELAKQESADKGSGARGGDLGFFSRGKMVEPFEKAAFALKKGEISALVESQFGFHILRLDDQRPAGTRPFAEVREALIAEIQSNVTQEARAGEAGKLREQGVLDVEAIEAFTKTRGAIATGKVQP